jgi:glutamate/tyrosine decarboxylase-like PLP-dependent enzyme
MYKRYRETLRCVDFQKDPYGTCSYGPYKNIPDIQTHLDTTGTRGPEEISGWFLGTKAENADVFSRLVQEAIDSVAAHRRFFHPEDPSHVTEQVKRSPDYLHSIQSLTDKFRRLLAILNEYATPFFSMRYQGHMNWDTTMAGNLGYFATMLHNPNNVSIQSSTATTFLEMMVGDDLCRMIGFSPARDAWAHITCDGTVANIEAMWSARELKLLPFGIKEALENEFSSANGLQVGLLDGSREDLKSLNTWQLLNLKTDDILSLPDEIAQHCGLMTPDVWEILSKKYSLNALGMIGFGRKYLSDINPPVYIVPSTKHYSLSKGAAILGIGTGTRQLLGVHVDSDSRMKMSELREKLDDCVKNRIPVILATAVIGSTEESAVDPLDEILALREEYRHKHQFDFNIHADAAWGGYHISVVRNDYDIQWPHMESHGAHLEKETFISDITTVPLSEYVIRQLVNVRHSDSVTIDPHKCGYIPYPAGSLAYKNKKMINLVTFGAPYIGSVREEQTMGTFGVEGSKPGAAAASVFLSHSVIRPSIKGYGKLLSQSLINTKLFYVYLFLMAKENDPFFVVPLPRLLGEKGGCDLDGELEFLRCNIHGRRIDDIMKDEKVRTYFNELGPDQNILNYAFNFFYKDGSVNRDINKVNALNQDIYDKLHLKPGSSISHFDLFVTITTFFKEDYGDEFLQTLATRLKVSNPQEVNEMKFLRSVVMDPWVSETELDESGLNFFQAMFIPKLREVVIDCVENFQNAP